MWEGWTSAKWLPNLFDRAETEGRDQLRLQTFGGHTFERPSAIHRIRIQRTDGEWEQFDASEVEQISAPLCTLQGLHGSPPALGKPLRATTAVPEILIGIRRFWELIRGFYRTDQGTYLVDTVFGTIAAGESFCLPTLDPDKLFRPILTVLPGNPTNREEMPPANAVEQFWSLETIGITDDPARDDDDEAVLQFQRSVRHLEDGHYSIRLPWRENQPLLPSNFQLAYRRLASLLKRLQSTPEVLAEIMKIFNEQKELMIIEEASAGTGQREHFLAHHAVITPKKVRVVYDGSAHIRNSQSLNDQLLSGPDMLPPLAGFLIRFRACRVPCVTDIQRAFLNVQLEHEDREM